jgi:hypothetical protein
VVGGEAVAGNICLPLGSSWPSMLRGDSYLSEDLSGSTDCERRFETKAKGKKGAREWGLVKEGDGWSVWPAWSVVQMQAFPVPRTP